MEAQAAVPVDAPLGEVLVPESIAGSEHGADEAAVMGPEDGSEHGEEHGDGNGGSIDGSAADDEPAVAAPLPEPDSEDDDDPSVDEEITNAMTATGMTEVFTLALPAMCSLLDVTHLTTPLFGNQVIKVGDDVTTFILTGGAARVRAAAAYADSLEGTGKVPAKLGMASLASAMYAMVEVLFDPASEAPVRHAVERDCEQLVHVRAHRQHTSHASGQLEGGELSTKDNHVVAEERRCDARHVAGQLAHATQRVGDGRQAAAVRGSTGDVAVDSLPLAGIVVRVRPCLVWPSRGTMAGLALIGVICIGGASQGVVLTIGRRRVDGASTASRGAALACCRGAICVAEHHQCVRSVVTPGGTRGLAREDGCSSANSSTGVRLRMLSSGDVVGHGLRR